MDYSRIFKPASVAPKARRTYWDILSMSPFQRPDVPKKVAKPEEIPNPLRSESPVDKPKITGSTTVDLQVQDNPGFNRQLLDQVIL